MMPDYVKKYYIAQQAIVPLLKGNPIFQKPGIYLFERTDEQGITFFYCGQAKNIYKRIVSHWMGWQSRLDKSLHKRGFKSEDNPYGWTCRVLKYCDETELDILETQFIQKHMLLGHQTYNVTYGSQGEGKKNIAEGKTPKGYHDGVAYGYKKAMREVKHLFDLHLNAVTKSDTPNKNQEKALLKFKELLEGETNDGNKE